jgi:16S rRNA G966 N2-methylase RsmD
LLARKVSKQSVLKLFGTDLYTKLSDIGFFIEKNDNITGNVFITPIENKLFLNDGDRFNGEEHHVIQIVMEQPYLIASVKSFAKPLLKNRQGSVLDLCTGSGVIGQSMLPQEWNLLGIDVNPRALDYAKINLELNNLKGKYQLLDATTAKLTDEYDIILANPPYNAMVPVEKSKSDLTLHSGIHGDEVPNACAHIARNNLKKNGMYFVCGTILLKDREPANKTLLEMSEIGTVIILHKAISSISTWEGMRLLYSCSPSYGKIRKGKFDEIAEQSEYFNQVTWAIVIYKNNGIPNLRHVYNQPSDAILISKEAKQQCLDILREN